MDLKTFGLLCDLLRTDGRLKNDGLVTVEEQVCMFLHMLAHHVKNRTIRNRFVRSGETISRYFNSVLQGILRLQGSLLRVPEPVGDNCTDHRWKWFKNCLGALDGTYIKVRVAETEKPRYRTRKGEIATNVLAVCSRDMQFIFVLPGWEGSASDSRVLRDAITRPNGLRVPTGYYYLVDGGYTNGEGFLAPYRGTRREMSRDPLEYEINEIEETENVIEGDMVGTIGASDEWTTWRNDLAFQMYNEWQGNANN
ncbi:hypothetical protein L3X38_043021 [Prunus dulcis]|uniref:DDE Tnp4 domain-containing protein n=1 Tax=Prunus dulcis TaxID=3755 RepID=A0AAD4UVN8_PRUDU|nr:uncharacterized protein LOC109947353 [Prunus persica]KAI5313845.1 hypothetical protein L3X38_043021 [Prunus dulcis]